MKANLFINYYVDKNISRQNELEICVLSNIYNKELDSINVFCGRKHIKNFENLLEKVQGTFSDKVRIHEFDDRPTYNDYFRLTHIFPDDINIIANTDMIIDESSLQQLKKWHWGRYCLALSRWDFINGELKKEDAIHFNRADSQDVWIVKGSFPIIDGVNFGLGVAGCDNKIAHLLSNYYEMLNPSLNIKTYHYHLSQVRNYTNSQGLPINRVDPPYKLIPPSSL